MSTPRRRIGLHVIAATIFLGTGGGCLSISPVFAIPYEFTRIADTSDFESLGPAADISDDGVVVFQGAQTKATAEGPITRLGIFAGASGGLLTIIADDLTALRGQPSINDFEVAAFASDDIFIGDGSFLTTIPARGTSPEINDDNLVVFQGPIPTGGSGMFSWSNGIFATIVLDRNADLGSPFQFLGLPDVNANGAIAFGARQVGGSSGIFLADGVGVSTLVDTTGIFSGFGSLDPAINDQGEVAFLANLDTGGEGIFTRTPSGIREIVTSSGGISTFAAAPSLNNHGTVAFVAHLDGGGDGIFVGPDLLRDKVIATGDPLLDSVVTDLAFASVPINDTGQLAFRAQLENGLIAIFRADPDIASAPEPTTLALLALGLAGLGIARRRRPFQA